MDKCDMMVMVLYAVLLLLVLILAGTVIKTSKKEDISWVLYATAILAGIGALSLLAFSKEKKKKAFMIGFPILTLITTIFLMVGMIIGKPELSTNQLVTPHFANILLLLSGGFVAFIMIKKDSTSK